MEIDGQTYKLPNDLDTKVKTTLEDWQAGDKVHRLWAGDKTLWTNDDENHWLGWLDITEDQLAQAEHLRKIAEDVKSAGFTHALLLGMGGSSLCPEVVSMTFGKRDDYPELLTLDSTDPAQIKSFEKRVDLSKTLFIVSSKSGTTLEPNIFKQYFYERLKEVVGKERAGEHFIAITDPGSQLHHIARRDAFRHIFFGRPSIGGRYSALSNFGMVPAAIMGIDVVKFLGRAQEMVQSCASCVPPEDNPGVTLGAIMGTLAKTGHDKVTVIASPRISRLGAWLEQLLAESTGKEGKGLIPIDQEQVGTPEVYGDDRLFVYVRLESEPATAQDAAGDVLEVTEHPVVRILVADPYELGKEFFRWEIATAVAGSIIGINPFNQPDVEASKIEMRKLTEEFEKTGTPLKETPFFEGNGIKLFTDDKNASALSELAGSDKSFVGYLRAHLGRLKVGDYLALLAYVEMNDAHHEQLQAIRHAIRDRKRVATCLGYGPRFLHSTGQAYKGGPNTGVFLQITCNDATDLPVPGQNYTFGIVKAAQARGDFQVLVERGRRALRVHLGKDVNAGLVTLQEAVEQALT